MTTHGARLIVLAAAVALGLTAVGHSRAPAQRMRHTVDATVAGPIRAYPVPRGVAHGNAFAVAARAPNGRWVPIQTYRAEVDYYAPSPASMAEWSASGPVQVRVTVLDATMQSAIVEPSDLDIHPVLSDGGRVATFTLPRPLDVAFTANGDIEHNLQLFVNSDAPEPPVRARHVIRFGPGLHVLGGDHVLAIGSHTTVEITAGAVVFGAIRITGTGAVLEGDGVLDPAPFFSPTANPGATVLITGAHQVGIRDLTILESAATGVQVQNSANVVISHVREINSVRWSDGIDVMASSHVLVEDSFLRTSDDSIGIYASTPWGAHGSTSDVTVRDCTLFPDVAHGVLIGTSGNPRGHDTIEHLLFDGLSVLQENAPDPEYQGTLAVDAGDNNTVSDVQFEDVNVERIKQGQLFNVQVFLNSYYDTEPGLAVRNVYFRNIAYGGDADLPSQISGYSATRTVSGVTFENVKRHGVLALRPEQANVDVGQFASGVSFIPTQVPTVIPNTGAGVSYTGPWRVRESSAGAAAGTVHVASSSRSTATVRFLGAQARVYATVDPQGGIASVSVDHGPQVLVDTYSAAPDGGQLVFDTGVLGYGRHTLTIRPTGGGDMLAQRPRLELESVDAIP